MTCKTCGANIAESVCQRCQVVRRALVGVDLSQYVEDVALEVARQVIFAALPAEPPPSRDCPDCAADIQ